MSRTRVTSPSPVLVVAALAGAGGIILLAAGVWAWGVVALLAATVLVLLGLVDRNAAARALADFRGRFAVTRESVALRSRGQMGVFKARRELAELQSDKDRVFRELGEAVYSGDEKGMNEARTAIDAVVERIRDKEAEIETQIRETEALIQRVQAPVQETVKLEAPPEPARVPEPWPPPDEGDIPEPPQPAPGEPTPGPEEPAPPAQPPGPGVTQHRG
jgi:chaperonin cofactor prefoldin